MYTNSTLNTTKNVSIYLCTILNVVEHDFKPLFIRTIPICVCFFMWFIGMAVASLDWNFTFCVQIYVHFIIFVVQYKTTGHKKTQSFNHRTKRVREKKSEQKEKLKKTPLRWFGTHEITQPIQIKTSIISMTIASWHGSRSRD